MYPILYLIAWNKDTSVLSLLSSRKEDRPHYWNLSFIRDFHDWEMKWVDSLMNLL
jgi:hypothetical protein